MTTGFGLTDLHKGCCCCDCHPYACRYGYCHHCPIWCNWEPRGGQVTSRGSRHIILRPSREEEARWWRVIVSDLSERIRALVLRGMRIDLLLALGRSRRLLFCMDFRDGATAIRAKAESGLLAKRGR